MVTTQTLRLLLGGFICLSVANSTAAASERRKHYFKLSSRQGEFTGSAVMKRLEADSMKQQDVQDNDTSAEQFVG